jgi:hypothetical protein
MNRAKIKIDSEMGKEFTEDYPESSHMPSNNRYNLRYSPTKRYTKYTMLQNGNQSTIKKISKPHEQIIKAQMNV